MIIKSNNESVCPYFVITNPSTPQEFFLYRLVCQTVAISTVKEADLQT